MAGEDTDPLVTLTQEAKKRLDSMKSEIAETEKDLAAMEELGMDVSVLREKIAWAKHAREIILKRLK